MKTWLALVMVAEKVYCRCEEEHRQPGASGRVQTEHNRQVVPGHRGDREGAKRAHGIPKPKLLGFYGSQEAGGREGKLRGCRGLGWGQGVPARAIL